MYVTRHEDEIAGPFESYEAARIWLTSLSGGRGDQAYIERLEDPVKTKALWDEWDGETDKPEVMKSTIVSTQCGCINCQRIRSA